MLGAIIGDTVGSVFEFNNTKDVNFPLFCERSCYTDDSLISLAVAKWLIVDREFSHKVLEEVMVQIATEYPCPMGGYGGGFSRWLFAPEKLMDFKVGTRASERRPYNSWGNGSAMRVAAVGWMFDTLEETERVAELSASITHNHPEGIKGAQAAAAAIFLARTGSGKEEIREYIQNRFGYDLSKTWADFHPTYGWEDSCQGTVPPAIIAFLDSNDFEDAIRLAVSLGGDSDTLACITGGIAEAFYKEISQVMIDQTLSRLAAPLRTILESFAASSFYARQYSKYVTPKRYTQDLIDHLEEDVILPRSFHEILEKQDKNMINLAVFDLSRFHEAQSVHYQAALSEIKDGYKRSHWMWFIFPQIKGLGRSSTAQYYAISCIDEAKAYLEDDVLGSRLREMCEELLKHSDRSVQAMLGGIDSMKLKSSMTLFDIVSPNDVFDKVLDAFYDGERDNLTLKIRERYTCLH